MTAANGAESERVLVVAPLGRDAAIAASILREAGVASAVCSDVGALVEELSRGVGVALIAEEALEDPSYPRLSHWMDLQPAWSDLPVVLITHRGGGLERNPAAGRVTEALGNVAFLERPFHPTTLVSVIQTALRGRRRQSEARDR